MKIRCRITLKVWSLTDRYAKKKKKKKGKLGRYNHKHVDMIVQTLNREDTQTLGKVFSIQNQSMELGMKLFLHVLFLLNQHQNRMGPVQIHHTVKPR